LSGTETIPDDVFIIMPSFAELKSEANSDKLEVIDIVHINPS
jgi:hypothetical protein